jgi:UDP-2,3-diacylglucosamine pyrophosphatase LpxH
MSTPKELSGLVVSDLHIFGCNSRYAKLLPQMYEMLAGCSLLVLNGDSFDFKRSIYKNSEETAKLAVDWLVGLTDKFKNTEIFLLLGNHDCHTILGQKLAQLNLENLSVHEHTLRLGSALFLHGDAVDLLNPEDSLKNLRCRYSEAEPSFLARSFAYLVSYSGANKIEYLLSTKASQVKRIKRYLDAAKPGWSSGVTDIYFGHTHTPFTGFASEGIRFHNTGSMIRGLRWQPLKFVATRD